MRDFKKDGTHQTWVGALDDRGRPTAVAGPIRVLAHRPVWCNYWGIAPQAMSGRRMQRACDSPCCVAPAHWILSNPVSVFRALNWSTVTRRSCRRAFASTGLSAARGAWWDLGQIESVNFGPPTVVVQALADQYGWPRLAILAAWSERVRKALKRRRSS